MKFDHWVTSQSLPFKHKVLPDTFELKTYIHINTQNQSVNINGIRAANQVFFQKYDDEQFMISLKIRFFEFKIMPF